MNTVDLKSIYGILNFVSSCDNFIKQYELIIGSNLYFYEELDISIKYGLVLMTDNKKRCINIPLSLKSFLTMKTPTDSNIIDINTIHSLFNVLSNKCSLNIVLGFIKDVHKEYFESYLLLEETGQFICSNLPVSDIFAIKNFSRFPFFINKEILDKISIDYGDVLKHIDIGIWRLCK